MFWKGFMLLCFVLEFIQLEAQLMLTEGAVNYTINFDETMSGVNESTFEGLGLHSDPQAGELDSDAWIINGCSDGNTIFSESYDNGDYARGSSNGNESLGGLYAFDTGANIALGWQSTASDLSPGEFILKVQNQSAFSIERLSFSYSVWILNNENRSQKMTLYYSLDNNVYTPLANSELISPTMATNEQWKDSSFSFSLDFTSFQNSDFLYIKWRIEDITGSGSRDEWAIDDISFKIVNNTCVSEGWALDSENNLISTEGFTLTGVNSYYESPNNYASHSPAARFDDDMDELSTALVADPYSMKFWIKGQGNTVGSYLEIAGFNGLTWQVLEVISPLPVSGTIMSLNNLSAYQQFSFSYHKVNGNLAIDDIQISCGSCELADNPPNAFGAITFSASYCNQSWISWDEMQADYYLVLATEKSGISTLPVDQFTYRSSSQFGLGEAIEDSVYVVYKGSSTSFLLQQIQSNTSYLLHVFPYNGLSCEENYSLTFLSNTLTSPDCDQCPSLLAAYVNPCETNCLNNEGYNELLFFSSGAYSFTADNSDFKVYLENQNSNFLNENMMSNPTLITQLNELSGCPTLFIDALSLASIPIHSTIMLCHSLLCIDDIDISVFCQYPVVYVICCESDDWNPNGELKNSGHLQQNIVVDISSIASSCILQYSYVPDDIPQKDGAYISFSPQGGMNISTALLDQCESEGNILPLTWGEIALREINGSVEISWQTLSELDNAGFSIERSTNGSDFTGIAWVESQGDGSSGFYYEMIDHTAASGSLYYRIKQVDMDGVFSYSKIVYIDLHTKLRVYQRNEELIIAGLEEKAYQIEMLTTSGQVVLIAKKKVQDEMAIALTNIKKGIYFLRIRNKDKIEVKKLFIN